MIHSPRPYFRQTGIFLYFNPPAVIVRQMKKGGIYITSGIIDDKETVVAEAVRAAGLEVLEINHQGEWVSVTARKN